MRLLQSKDTAVQATRISVRTSATTTVGISCHGSLSIAYLGAGCAHPYDGTNKDPSLLTRQQERLHKADTVQRRIDCGATHSPPPFKSKANGGLAIPSFGQLPDEYPFASTKEGGLTRYDDGAGLLGVPNAEQTS